MKRKVYIILTCAMCLLPFSLAHAEGEVMASIPTPCQNGDHVGVLAEQNVMLGYDSDSSGHWKQYGDVVRCNGCHIKLEEIVRRDDSTKDKHSFEDKQCIICGYNK